MPENERPCSCCGQERVVINEHVTRQIELVPAQAHVEVHVRYTYACKYCRSGEQVVTTAKPPAPIEKSPFGASVLAWIISSKFERHLPTYRHQEMLLSPLGLWLSRPLLCQLLKGSARALKLLAERLLREILLSYVLMADETKVRYLGGQPGQSLLGYLFGYGGDADHRYLWYDFRPHRGREGPREVLGDFRGVLLTDGFSGYESLASESQGRLTAAACWMHARRRFDEALYTTSHVIVEETLARIGLLYDMEERAKGLSFEARGTLPRRKRGPWWNVSLPVGKKYGRSCVRHPSWLRQLAMRSIVKRSYRDFSKMAGSNSTRAIWSDRLRGPAVGRRNWLFFGSLSGGRTAATLYSVVQSARLHHLDVTAYLTDVLRRLPALMPNDDDAIGELLPDRWAKTHPQHVLAARVEESRTAAEHRRQRRAARRLLSSV